MVFVEMLSSNRGIHLHNLVLIMRFGANDHISVSRGAAKKYRLGICGKS